MILKPPPNMPFELNRDSHQADGLVFWWPTVLGDSFNREYFSGHTMRTGNGSWTQEMTKYGWMYRSAGNSYRTVPFNAFTGPPYTLFTIGIAPQWTTWQTILSVGDSTQSTTNAGNLMSSSTTGKFRFEVSDTAGNSASETTLAWTINHVCMSAGVAVTNSERYVYGANEAGTEKSAVQTTTRTPTAYNQVRVGGKVILATSSNWNGFIGDSRIYNRAMSYEEFLEIRENPWELYRPIVPVFYSIPDTVITPYTNQLKRGGWPY